MMSRFPSAAVTRLTEWPSIRIIWLFQVTIGAVSRHWRWPRSMMHTTKGYGVQTTRPSSFPCRVSRAAIPSTTWTIRPSWEVSMAVRVIPAEEIISASSPSTTILPVWSFPPSTTAPKSQETTAVCPFNSAAVCLIKWPSILLRTMARGLGFRWILRSWFLTMVPTTGARHKRWKWFPTMMMWTKGHGVPTTRPSMSGWTMSPTPEARRETRSIRTICRRWLSGVRIRTTSPSLLWTMTRPGWGWTLWTAIIQQVRLILLIRRPSVPFSRASPTTMSRFS